MSSDTTFEYRAEEWFDSVGKNGGWLATGYVTTDGRKAAQALKNLQERYGQYGRKFRIRRRRICLWEVWR